MGLWAAFSLWNRAQVMSDMHVEASATRLNHALAAEDTVAGALREIGHAHVHTRRRVYVESQSRNREIDVILVCGKGLFVIEVKNWAGYVWRNGIKWFQKAPSASRALEFEDLQDECRFKAKALAEFLRKRNKVLAGLRDEDVHHVLVFTNSSVKLCPTSVLSMGNVFTTETLKAFIGPAEGWASATMAYLFPLLGPTIPEPMRQAATEAMNKLRTWDTVMLHNGTTVHGDILSIEAPNFGVSYTRDDITNMTIEWCSTSLWGLLRSLWQGGAAMMRINLVAHQRKKALKGGGGGGGGGGGSGSGSGNKNGDKHRKNSNAGGKRPGRDVRSRNEDGNLRFFIGHSKKRFWRHNDRIIVRPAGKPGTEEYCLCDIKHIGYQGREAIRH